MGVVEADLDTRELGVSEADPAAGEAGTTEVDATAVETGKAEVDHTPENWAPLKSPQSKTTPEKSKFKPRQDSAAYLFRCAVMTRMTV